MGTVYFGSTVIGSSTEDTVGSSGNVFFNGVDVGNFTLVASGYVYYGSTAVGTYTATATTLYAREQWLAMKRRLTHASGRHVAGVSPAVVNFAQVGKTRVSVIIPMYDELKERLKQIE